MPETSIQLEKDEYPGSSDLTAIAQYCRDLYIEYSSSSYRKGKLEEIEDGRKRYKGDRPPKSFPWKDCSNLSVGLEAIAVDNLEPRVAAQLIGDGTNYVQAVPVGPEDAQKVDDVTEFMKWAAENNIEAHKILKSVVHDMLMDGTVFVIPVWTETVFENHIRTVMPVFEDATGRRVRVPPDVSLDPMMIQQFGLKPVGLEDGVKSREVTDFKVSWEMVRVPDAFFPDTGDDFAEQPFGRFIYPTLGELEEMSQENGGPYKNIDADLVRHTDQVRSDAPDDDEQRKNIQHSEYSKEVPILEFQLKWQGEWHIASFAVQNNWREVRMQKLSDVSWTNKKTVRRFPVFRETNESLGTGIPTKIRHYAKGIDDLYNQMVDAGTLEIAKPFFYNEQPGFSTLDLAVMPGKGIPIGKDSNVYFPTIQTNAVQMMAFIEALLGFFERMISLSDYTLGRQSSTAGKGGETYSGMALIVQEGNTKHNYQGETLRDVLGELFTDSLSLYAQYMPIDAKQRVFEANEWVFKPLDVMAIQGCYDIKVVVSDASANKMLNRKEKVELLQMNAQSPVTNIMKLTQDVMRSYGIKDTREYINPNIRMAIQAVLQNPEVVQVIQQFMQQSEQKARDQQIAGEAQANIRRQAIQRQVELPFEDQKLTDQAVEGVKRKQIKEQVEEAASEGA